MKSIKKNAVLNVIKTIMTITFPMISFPYASRVLGVDGIGAVQYASSVISYFVLLSGLGIGTYAVREGSRIRDNKKQMIQFSTEVFTINIISMLLTCILLVIVIYLNVFKIEIMLMAVSCLSILGTTFAVDWLYQIKEDYAAIAFRSVIFQFISLAFMFLFVRDPNDYVAYALANVIGSCGYCIINFCHAKKYIKFRLIFSKIDLRRHLKPIIMIFSISIASSIYLNLDTVMLGMMVDKYAVGLYSVAVKLTSIIRLLVTSIGVVVLPRLSYYLHLGYKEKYVDMLKIGVNVNLMLSIPCAIGMILLSDKIIEIFSGKEFIGASFASQILAINMIFSVLDNLLYYQVLLPHRMEKLASIGTIVGALSNILLNFLLIPSFYINGAAFATLVSECLVCIIFLLVLKFRLNLKDLFKSLWKFIFSVIVMSLVCFTLMNLTNDNIISTIFIVIVSAICYFLILYVLKVPEMQYMTKRRKGEKDV